MDKIRIGKSIAAKLVRCDEGDIVIAREVITDVGWVRVAARRHRRTAEDPLERGRIGGLVCKIRTGSRTEIHRRTRERSGRVLKHRERIESRIRNHSGVGVKKDVCRFLNDGRIGQQRVGCNPIRDGTVAAHFIDVAVGQLDVVESEPQYTSRIHLNLHRVGNARYLKRAPIQVRIQRIFYHDGKSGIGARILKVDRIRQSGTGRRNVRRTVPCRRNQLVVGIGRTRHVIAVGIEILDNRVAQCVENAIDYVKPYVLPGGRNVESNVTDYKNLPGI